jgi:hypothetical protein
MELDRDEELDRDDERYRDLAESARAVACGRPVVVKDVLRREEHRHPRSPYRKE